MKNMWVTRSLMLLGSILIQFAGLSQTKEQKEVLDEGVKLFRFRKADYIGISVLMDSLGVVITSTR